MQREVKDRRRGGQRWGRGAEGEHERRETEKQWKSRGGRDSLRGEAKRRGRTVNGEKRREREGKREGRGGGEERENGEAEKGGGQKEMLRTSQPGTCQGLLSLQAARSSQRSRGEKRGDKCTPYSSRAHFLQTRTSVLKRGVKAKRNQWKIEWKKRNDVLLENCRAITEGEEKLSFDLEGRA